MKHSKSMFVMIAFAMGTFSCAYGTENEVPPAAGIQNKEYLVSIKYAHNSQDPLSEGVLVAHEEEAKRIAFETHFSKTAEMDNVQIRDCPEIANFVRVPFEIPDFAIRGEYIWEVRIMNLGQLRSVIWVHPHTASTYSICGPWDVHKSNKRKKLKINNLPAPEGYINESQYNCMPDEGEFGIVGNYLYTNKFAKCISVKGESVFRKLKSPRLKGTKIYAEEYACRLAEEASGYVGGVSGSRTITAVEYIITIGYTIPGFAESGDQLWEVQIGNGSVWDIDQPGGIFWVNPHSSEVYIVWGQWLIDGTDQSRIYNRYLNKSEEPVITITPDKEEDD